MSSAHEKNFSARLAAVQAVYQSILNNQPLKSVLEEYKTFGNNRDAAEPPMVRPDGALLEKILLGVHDRRADLEDIIKANLSNKTKEPESLLQAVFLCAATELVANSDIDAPVIINDYLNVTHSFFEAGEVKLVNAVLDSITKAVRSQG